MTEPEKETKVKRFNWWAIPIVTFGVGALTFGVIYFNTVNLFFAFLSLVCAGVAVACLLAGQKFAPVMQGIIAKPPVMGKVNTMCIYVLDRDGQPVPGKIAMENRPEQEIDKAGEKDPNYVPLGERWYFEDWNAWHYVIYLDLKSGKWIPFELPDSKYTDPARMSIPLNLARVNELFTPDPNLLDQLKPYILVASITIVGFLMFLEGSG